MNQKELRDTNGGGLIGAITGYVIGVYAGAVVATGTYVACTLHGEKGEMVSKAIVTSFTATVVSCTAVGAFATGIF